MIDLRAADLSKEPVLTEDLRPDPQRYADALEKLAGQTRRWMTALRAELRSVDRAVIEKKDVLAEYRKVFIRTARIFEDLCRLCQKWVIDARKRYAPTSGPKRAIARAQLEARGVELPARKNSSFEKPSHDDTCSVCGKEMVVTTRWPRPRQGDLLKRVGAHRRRGPPPPVRLDLLWREAA